MEPISTEKSETGRSETVRVVDPVCGMKVDPATAKFRSRHRDRDYFFCCGGCLAKFQTNPEKLLSSAPTPMSSGLVSLRMGQHSTAASHNRLPADGGGMSGNQTYVCPMCEGVKQQGPG